jgi:hypothetical protein
MKAAALLLSVFTASGAVGQTEQIRVLESHRISTPPQPFDVVESFLAVNPADSDNLIAAAMGVSSDESLVYTSRDGGATWQPATWDEGTVFLGGDPMIAFDGNGRAFFTTITPEFQVWRSDDGGASWTGPTQVPGRSFDRQWVAASPTARGTATLVHAASKTPRRDNSRIDDIAVTVSPDGGVSFPEPRIIRPDSGYLHTVTDLLVLGDGTVVLPYQVHYGAAPGGRALLRGRRWVLLSHNDGRDWSGPHEVAETFDYGNANWDQAMKGLGGGAIAADETAGPFGGNLYMVWPTAIEDRLQIVAARSGDGGLTWHEPVRVNDGGYRSNHSTPAVAVNHEGVVAVAWYDRRNDPSDACFQPFMAVSTDGGASFHVNTPLSDAFTCPGERSRWLNGGDTQGIVALPDGTFRTAWISGTRGSLALWTTAVEVTRE